VAPLRPGRAFMADYFAASLVHLRAGRYSPQGLANTAVALALLDCRPPPLWAAAFLRAAGAALPRGSPRDLASTLWALAMLDVRPPPEWGASLLGAAAVPGMSAGQLGGVLWALARLELQPGEEWVAAFHQRAREVSVPLHGGGGSGGGAAHGGGGGGGAAHRGGGSDGGSLGGGGGPLGLHGAHVGGGISFAHGDAEAAPAAAAAARGGYYTFSAGSRFSPVILEGLTAWAGAPGRLSLGPLLGADLAASGGGGGAPEPQHASAAADFAMAALGGSNCAG
jgi:hypothetical protein